MVYREDVDRSRRMVMSLTILIRLCHRRSDVCRYAGWSGIVSIV
jgi:hypothetical protein